MSNTVWQWFPKAVGVAILIVIGFLSYQAANPKGFTDEDIQAAKEAIRSEFGKRNGVTVKEVVLLRDGANKLNGFVKFEFLEIPAMQKCSALMDDKSRQYMWSCE